MKENDLRKVQKVGTIDANVVPSRAGKQREPLVLMGFRHVAAAAVSAGTGKYEREKKHTTETVRAIGNESAARRTRRLFVYEIS